MHERDAAVEFESVTKSFDGQPVLHDICLALARNSVTAIVGESGSGKSTLLQLINGLHRPDTGIVSVMGNPIAYESVFELRRQIGYAVQGVGLFPHLSAGDNVDLLAKLCGWQQQHIIDRRRQLMTLMELEPGLALHYPHQLSGGQQQRFGLCRAMMLQPRLLLLDEPFSGVDPITRQGIHREFLHLQKTEPTSVALVTHDLREARKLAQHLVIIRAGRIVQTGPTDEVIASPADGAIVEACCGSTCNDSVCWLSSHCAVFASPRALTNRIVVGSKTFTESYVLAEMLSQLLEAAGFDVERQIRFRRHADLLRGSGQRRDRCLSRIHRDH